MLYYLVWCACSKTSYTGKTNVLRLRTGTATPQTNLTTTFLNVTMNIIKCLNHILSYMFLWKLKMKDCCLVTKIIDIRGFDTMDWNHYVIIYARKYHEIITSLSMPANITTSPSIQTVIDAKLDIPHICHSTILLCHWLETYLAQNNPCN